jgi:hypothetical protein
MRQKIKKAMEGAMALKTKGHGFRTHGPLFYISIKDTDAGF